MSAFKEWTCVFPGKMGLSWKHAYPYESYATKEEAEVAAARACNIVAVPVQLFEKMKEYERRAVAAERALPEFVGALEEAAGVLEDLDSKVAREILDKARAIIAKATGESADA